MPAPPAHPQHGGAGLGGGRGHPLHHQLGLVVVGHLEGAGSAVGAHVATVVVAPRLGTLSPWASKATDIAHNCGVDVRRVEPGESVAPGQALLSVYAPGALRIEVQVPQTDAEAIRTQLSDVARTQLAALEIAWSIIPLIIVMGLFVWSTSIFLSSENGTAHTPASVPDTLTRR